MILLLTKYDRFKSNNKFVSNLLKVVYILETYNNLFKVWNQGWRAWLHLKDSYKCIDHGLDWIY